jgi:hypothetical protein
MTTATFETIQAELDKIVDTYAIEALGLAASLQGQVAGVETMLQESGLDAQTQSFLVSQFLAKIEAIGG